MGQIMTKKIIKKEQASTKSSLSAKNTQSEEGAYYWKDPNSLYYRAYAKPDKVEYNGIYKRSLDAEHLVRMHGLFGEENPDVSEKERENHRKLLNNIASQCTEIYEYLERIDNFKNVPKGFSQSFAYSISKLSVFTLYLGGFTGMIPDFQFKGARRKGTEPGRRAREKSINRRQEIIKATFPDMVVLSKATAKLVIRKCKDTFTKAGILRFSESTINRDIKVILSE